MADNSGEAENLSDDVRTLVKNIEDIMHYIQNSHEDHRRYLNTLNNKMQYSVEFITINEVDEEWVEFDGIVEGVPNDIDTFEEAIVTNCTDILSALEEVRNNNGGIEENIPTLFVSIASLGQAATSFNNQLSKANQIYSFTGNVRNAFSSVKSWLTKNLLPAIKNAANKIWNLIQNFTNLLEWSVGGNLGVGVLGLHGNANISLTFGP